MHEAFLFAQLLFCKAAGVSWGSSAVERVFHGGWQAAKRGESAYAGILRVCVPETPNEKSILSFVNLQMWLVMWKILSPSLQFLVLKSVSSWTQKWSWSHLLSAFSESQLLSFCKTNSLTCSSVPERGTDTHATWANRHKKEKLPEITCLHVPREAPTQHIVGFVSKQG